MNARTICFGLAVALASMARVAVAQPEVEWERTYGGNSADELRCLLKTSDGGFLLGGSTEIGNNDTDIWLVKTDSEGTPIWDKTYGYNNLDKCRALYENEDSTLIVASSVSLPGRYTDFGIMKMTPEGDTLWTCYFGGFEQEWPFRILKTPDHGYLILGFTLSFGNGSLDAWLLKINENGDSLWSRTYGGYGPDSGHDILAVDDQNYLIVGKSQVPNRGEQIYLVKINSIGDVIWEKYYGNTGNDSGTKIIMNRDGNLSILGTAQAIGNEPFYDMLYLELSSDGDSLWSSTYGTRGQDYGMSHIQLADHGFVLLGYSTTYEIGRYELFVVRIDRMGETIWSGNFGRNPQRYCSGIEIIYEDIPDYFDVNLVIAGTCFPQQDGNRDYFLLKTTPDPVSVRESQVVAPFALHLAQPYPNPFNSTVTIPFSFSPINRGATGVVRMAIFDPLGRQVADFSPRLPQLIAANRHSLTWNASGMPAGQYIVRLEAGNQQLSQRLSLVK